MRRKFARERISSAVTMTICLLPGRLERKGMGVGRPTMVKARWEPKNSEKGNSTKKPCSVRNARVHTHTHTNTHMHRLTFHFTDKSAHESKGHRIGYTQASDTRVWASKFRFGQGRAGI